MRRYITIMILILLTTAVAQGQITIGGNVYGGGNKGNIAGSTSVTVKSGNLNKVFGGSRMSNVGGNTLVNIDGANATGYMVINYVYGGNDIAGTIGTAAAVGEPIPPVVADNKDNVDYTWNTYVRLSSKLEWGNVYDSDGHIEKPAKIDSDNQKVFIGQLFAGSNGDYFYDKKDENQYEVYTDKTAKEAGEAPIASSSTEFTVPEVDRSYLDMQGGTVAFVHGGGNNATVREKAVIHVDNPSMVVTQIYIDNDELETDKEGAKDSLITDDRIKTGMDIRMAQEHIESSNFQVDRFFGGNNKAEMSIRPLWNLQRGKIRNLYSGGNRGKMTSPEGLLLELNPDVSDSLVVDNVYGGCRMADVIPMVNGDTIPCTNLPGYHFPDELSARVLVRGGDINNVFGGNDVTGTVYGGNAIGIYSSISGDVYGGGNGAYAYTDMDILENDSTYGDFYFSRGDKSPIEALNAFRPNAEQVSIRLAGKGPGPNATVIKGSVFVGGNCATLNTKKEKPLVELKIGSHVIANNVFLGNNGEMMVDKDILKKYADNNYSSINLKDKVDFIGYMEGVAMDLQPTVVFDKRPNDPDDYDDYTSYVGSFYCGGNVGSMAIPENNIYKISRGLNIFKKFVGGCNNANVAEGPYNAAYEGGVLGTAEERDILDETTGYTNYYETVDGKHKIKDRIELNLNNLTIQPMRWDDEFTQVTAETTQYLNNAGKLIAGEEYYATDLRETQFIANGDEDPTTATYYKLTKVGDNLEWNTVEWSIDEDEHIKVENSAAASNAATRLLGGNIYGGCYNSGHVNGNVIININEDVIKREDIFPETTEDEDGTVSSGVIFESQRDDLEAVAMSVFGAGYGKDTEIWGSTTVNLNKGYALQVYGGGEKGVVGKKTSIYNEGGHFDHYEYLYDPAYSTTVNLNGITPIYSDEGTTDDLAEAEYIYGGGNEGNVSGNTYVNLGNGRIYDAFGGACNADILGHTEVYIGRQPNGSGYKDGFPWILDIVYGGNDFGGTIYGEYETDYDVTRRVRDYATNSKALEGTPTTSRPGLLKSASYVEYLQGSVDTIFGGNYGYYDYKKEYTSSKIPYLSSSFVNIRPNSNENNSIVGIFGGGTGYPQNRDGDKSQDRSYVLIDIPDDVEKFKSTEIFGAGSYNGLGMRYTKDQTLKDGFVLDSVSAVIDLLHGQVGTVYGGSYNEGNTRRTVVNVPTLSTIKLKNIFGGSYGTQILPPCDVYETNVNYSSDNACVTGAIYGGNNNERRSLFTNVNISSAVWSDKKKGYLGTVYGAGHGIDTWSEHTQVNLNKGAKVYNVFGGGEMGHVLNAESVQKYMILYSEEPSPQIAAQDPNWNTRYESWAKAWEDAWTLGDYFKPTASWNTYAANAATNLSRFSDRAELDDATAALLHDKNTKKFNTNVIINEGATVEGYAYGGGYGDSSEARTGDVYGTTYIALLGGIVNKDVYAAGRSGGLDDLFGAGYTASANAYIQGGMCRNVYGGGYEGHVGHHVGDITATIVDDRLAAANVVIGKVGNNTFLGGAPAIMRNAYGGGEGGSVYGTTKITLNNGYIGYRCKNTGTEDNPNYEYFEELDDQNPNDIEMAGNIFGGGYVINSYVDNANVNMYGGTVRGSLYGGGEIGPIGRGTMKAGTYSNYIQNGAAYIFKAGQTHVNMYDGHVLRNVFGGGRGKDSWGGDGTMFMDQNLVATLDMKCKGYVFGQTDVNIYGGEIGTDEGMAYGYGNVFGGGDEGSVYSAYMNASGELCYGKKSGVRYNKGLNSDDAGYNYQGYYYKYENGNFLTHNVAAEGQPEKLEQYFTEDCHVLIEPHCYATAPMKIDGKDYKSGDYVPTSALNTLKDKTAGAAYWDNLDDDGIIIHNAVFAGGNIASGSSSMYANETTVFGNATATIHDIYNRDLITIGTGHTGGLYGDGNLTFVDGYRELNITNYGTDYYHLTNPLAYEEYKKLPEREKAYYELKYKCDVEECVDIEGTKYTKGSELPQDELLVLFTLDNGKSKMLGSDSIIITVAGKKVPNPAIWKENGVVSVYAGRIMNTIQRADFCGVFGSRMVMKGAQDRVPEEVDYTNYTINRVREVSLNKVDSKAGDTGENATHGNYFGIYSIVNYLGAITSDVDFHSPRTTNADLKAYPALAADGTTTFAKWKEDHKTDKSRNNGTCHNHLALASGVYLELTTEESTGNKLEEKAWGPITGVVELDLINVQPGIGGGFVYAKNQHGVRSVSGNKTTTLTALNTNAKTQWDWNYAEADADRKEWETSGNFIHSSQTIVDDCYNISGRYKKEDGVPAHYWFISGSVYVYDQYISAYTGSPSAYSKSVEMPITINAASNGKMTLMDVRPNLYAYYSAYTSESANTKLGDEQKMVINNVTYHLNDPINFWDWNKLSASEKKLFVSDTYVVKDSCYINNKYYAPGYVMLPEEYNSLETIAKANKHVVEDGKPAVPAVKLATKDADGASAVVKDDENKDVYVAFADAFRSSNNMSHDKGYLLIYNVTNPSIWDQWYTKIDSEEGEKQQVDETGYEDAPTYCLKSDITSGMLLGQRSYAVNDIIPENIYQNYEGYDKNNDGDYNDDGDIKGLKQRHSEAIPTGQAEFVPAYIVTKETTTGGTHYYPGAPVKEEISGYSAPAYICTSTIKLSDSEYIYVNELMTEDEKTTYYNKFNKSGATDEEKNIAKDINELIVPAYYCKTAGLYGGDYYAPNTNYRALEVWSAMSESDRQNFIYNYDALDLLVDSLYGKKSDGSQQTQGKKYQYDGATYDWIMPTITSEDSETDKKLKQAEIDNMIYSLTKPIDYTATYNSDTELTDLPNGVTLKRGSETKTNQTTIQKDDELSREAYESLPNERRHYAAITVKPEDVGKNIYVVNTGFVHVETPYAVGMTLDSDAYGRLSDIEKGYITTLTFSEGQMDKTTVENVTTINTTTFYYCRESYKVNEKGEGVDVTDFFNATKVYTASTADVPVGTVISAGNYGNLPNRQLNFAIHGVSPMETSTLYVSRNSDINDLSKEKIITVIYKYDYEDSDADGTHITPVSERHIVNIHITFKSGVPIVPDIDEPTIVLPGTSVTMRTPVPTPGAYEILGGGWELFEKKSDAENHTNGVPYTPNVDSLYWYQDEFLLAYYAKTYLGKTYSNAVPVHVANYHDLKKVMDDKNFHLHVDYDRSRLKRESKIYINDYSSSSQNGIDLLKDFYDLSLITKSTTGITFAGDSITNTGHKLKGHHLLNNDDTNGVPAGKNLQFYLRTDIDHSGSSGSATWTPIASGDDPCFNGTLHGDGHTISGLKPATGTTGSLFGKLCGNVYNLGVTGSFTGGGVADEGDGYVESCWVKTSGTPGSGVKAVFGNPSASGYEQTVNCYYPETNAFAEGSKATAMPERAFYNGEVAYDLNNFYLYKRYNDHITPSGSAVEYKYWKPGETELQTGKYASNPAYCSSGYSSTQFVEKYVESRFADGDFIFADGTIPTSNDDRHWTETIIEGGKDTEKDRWSPIWPDDYIFFGQRLTYGYAEEAHQDLPSAIIKSGNRLDLSETGNRIYRAPAYYRDSKMGVAHFNPKAYLAWESADHTKKATLKKMTAIDFAGHNAPTFEGSTYGLGALTPSSGSAAGTTQFYPPLLDDGGLTGITNCDETQNLLVYAPAAMAESGYANKETHDVLIGYFTDPEYEDYYDNSDEYRLVGKYEGTIRGHIVQSNLKATNDHLLVDYQDFNAPISYTFTSGRRMWYQRTPESGEFVDRNTGWQDISIPFTAELVTTHQKGEITHFYSGSDTSANSDSRVGHEYWLRNLKSLEKDSESSDIILGNFTYPDATGDAKTVTNKFLWNYYYKNESVHNQQDRNNDTYLQFKQYYNRTRTYESYPLLTKGTPYILGLPGSIYYEFDLGGNFEAQNTAVSIDKLAKQTITFASAPNITIGVSDNELKEESKTVGNNKYTYRPSYMSEDFTESNNAYAMNNVGNAYDKITTKTTVGAFRPYFIVTTTSSSRPTTRSIVFTNNGEDIELPHESLDRLEPGTIIVHSGKHKIIVKSTLKRTATVHIVSTSGITIRTFDIEPDETIETRVNIGGVYIVQTTDGKDTKKIAVK